MYYNTQRKPIYKHCVSIFILLISERIPPHSAKKMQKLKSERERERNKNETKQTHHSHVCKQTTIVNYFSRKINDARIHIFQSLS